MHKTPGQGGPEGLAFESDDGGEGTAETFNIVQPLASSSAAPSDTIIVPASAATGEAVPRLLHASTFPIRLNETWQVAYDDLQWKLQCRRGDRWHDRSFCVTKHALLRCIREHVDGTADLTSVDRLGEWHTDRGSP
jgi:hypothetical protein